MSEIKRFTQVIHDQCYANINKVGCHKEDHDMYISQNVTPYSISFGFNPNASVPGSII